MIFVSYAREDEGWIEALELDKSRAGTQNVRFWTDRGGIHVGDDWTNRVQDVLSTASAAVLLISRNFLASHPIMETELPMILERYRAGKLAVVFVPIGELDVEEVGRKLRFEQVHNIVSVPAWSEALPVLPQRRPDIVEQIVSAASETSDVQNLRRNLVRKYRLESKLQAGTVGQAFIALDTQLQRRICIKLLTQQELYSDFEASLQRIAAATDHTNVLTLYGAYLDQNPPYFVRQFVDGVSLRTYLDERKKPLRPMQVQEFLTQIGGAVVHAHAKRVSGFSIKPTNIMITDTVSAAERRFMISLNSFPEEKFLEDDAFRVSSGNKAVLYLPPEHRSGSRDDSDAKKADQYRLGVIAYEMLVGAERFAALAVPLRERELAPCWHWPPLEQVPPTLECPEDLRSAIERMVRPDPDDRYDSLTDALRDIAIDIHVQIARDSYRRIMLTPDSQKKFFHTFYARFLQAFPHARRVFAHLPPLQIDAAVPVEWDRQFQKLKEAVLLLLVFSALHEDRQEPNILTRIVESHALLEIPAWMYAKFAEMLIDCIADIDQRPAGLSDVQLKRAWTRVAAAGVEYMRRRTDELNELRWRRSTHP